MRRAGWEGALKIKAIVVCLAVVAIAVAACLSFSWRKEASPADSQSKEGKPAAKIAEPKRGKAVVGKRAAKPSKKADKTTAKKAKRKRIRVADTYTPEERRLADDLQEASNANDLGEVRKAVAEIMSQKNAELKNEAISALGFFGKDALSDLMKFLKDPSLEVVDSATETISSALSELEDEENGFKAEFISTLLSIEGLCGKDAIDTFAGQLESLGSSDEKLAVQTMVQLIEDGKVDKKVKARLKEAYEFVTSEEYTTFEAAEKWWNQKTEEEAAEAAEDSEADDDKPRDDVKDDSDNDDKGAQT